MKRIFAIILSLCMILALAACGKGTAAAPDTVPAEPVQAETAAETVDEEGEDLTAELPDEVSAPDGKYPLAFITEFGDIQSNAFNKGIYTGVKNYAVNKGLSYKHYHPDEDQQTNDEDMFEILKKAVNNGAEIVVCCGYDLSGAITRAAAEFPEVKFICVDGTADGTLPNVAGISFSEEQSGFLAGYAAVREGYTKLGFMGGGNGVNAAVCRYLYGYAQGADMAGIDFSTDVELKYSWLYGGAYSATPELYAMANDWYENGTQVIFACGGSMFSSVASAALLHEGAKVIGVDVDQSYQTPVVLTSALKGLTTATEWALEKAFEGGWDTIGGRTVTLGAADGAVGLPTDTWNMTVYTVEDHDRMLADMANCVLNVDDTVYENAELAQQHFPRLNVSYVRKFDISDAAEISTVKSDISAEDLSLEKHPEALDAFNEATESLLGVGYTPIAFLGSRVTETGTNYCFFCSARTVTPNAEPYNAVVYVTRELEGTAKVGNIVKLELDK